MMLYNFNEILSFLMFHGLWGMQVFNVRGNDDEALLQLVYNRQGVSIYVCEYWGYYEILGLIPEHFEILQNAYVRELKKYFLLT